MTILSRQGSSSTFPENVKVVHADYDSFESLKSALKGQDAIVSNVASHALDTQTKIIDAAIAAGVKRFIPSEFGSNTTDPRAVEAVPFFKGKTDIQDYLKSKGDEISYTAIVTGPFFGELACRFSKDVFTNIPSRLVPQGRIPRLGRHHEDCHNFRWWKDCLQRHQSAPGRPCCR